MFLRKSISNMITNWREKSLGNQRGSVVIFMAVAIIATFAFAVLGIDAAIMMTTKNQLSRAADSAALAGASGLVAGDQAVAIDRAINYASYNSAVQDQMRPVVITAADITFPEPDIIRVRTHRTEATGDPLRTYFLKILRPFSNNTADVSAIAAAQAFDICSARCLKPWAIPDRWDDTDLDGVYDDGEVYDPIATGYNAPVDIGATITLKVGNPQQAINSGVFFPVNYPPIDKYPESPLTGGAWYETWIAECEPYLVEAGDRLQIEPGNMVGPTVHGMDDLYALDPAAQWDATTNSIINSNFGLSPRVGLVPFFDPSQPPESGRNWVTVTKIGAFFIEQVGPGSQVRGRFIQVTTQGERCEGDGNGTSFIKGIALIE